MKKLLALPAVCLVSFAPFTRLAGGIPSLIQLKYIRVRAASFVNKTLLKNARPTFQHHPTIHDYLCLKWPPNSVTSPRGLYVLFPACILRVLSVPSWPIQNLIIWGFAILWQKH